MMKTIRFPTTHRAVPWLATLILAGCAANPSSQEAPEAPPAAQCTEPRPQICTMEYLPVCARLADGSQTTYASGCSACADTAVLSHIPGECP